MTQGDTWSYLIPGRNLVLHGAFATGGIPELDRTPGYPIFAELSGMILNNTLLTVCVQIALSLLSIWVAATIAERLFLDRRAAVLTAWLLACEPLSVVSTARIMPETLFVALLLLCLERLQRFLSEPNLAYLAQSGFFLALATFVRPVSYYLVLPLALGVAAYSPRRNGLKWKAPGTLCICVLPFLLAWQLRNFAETGYAGFSSIVEKNLYFYQSAEITAEMNHLSLAAQQRQLGYPDNTSYFAAHPEQRTWNQAQRLKFMKSEAVSVMRQHPLMYIRSHLIGVAIVAVSPGATEVLQMLNAYPRGTDMPRRLVNEGVQTSARQALRSHPGIAPVMMLFAGFALLLYGAAFIGLLSSRRIVSPWMLAGTALYFLLISGGAQAVARYRLPAIPELCILASGGICALYDKTKRSRNSSSVPEHTFAD